MLAIIIISLLIAAVVGITVAKNKQKKSTSIYNNEDLAPEATPAPVVIKELAKKATKKPATKKTASTEKNKATKK